MGAINSWEQLTDDAEAAVLEFLDEEAEAESARFWAEQS